MTNIKKPIISDETGQAIKAGIKEAASNIIDKITGNKTKSTIIYGFHINSAEADPSMAVTYLKDAVGMTPAHMNYLTNKFSYGSWSDAFFMPKPCMVKYDGTVDYYLDPNDYDKKINGEISDIGDPNTDYGVKYQGNAMMEWGTNNQQIWTKVLPDADDPYSGSVFISNKKIDENYVAWPFINYQGNLVDHFYTAIYDGSITGYITGGTTYYRLRSIPRRILMNSQKVNSYDIPWDDDTSDPPSRFDPVSYNSSTRTDAARELKIAMNNNLQINQTIGKTYYGTSEDVYPNEEFFTANRDYICWFTEVFCDIQLINNLLILIGKSLNTQEIFGNGNINSSDQTLDSVGILYSGSHGFDENNNPEYGMLNKAGLFWGSNAEDKPVKVFGMENWWGNQFHRYAGHLFSNSSIAGGNTHKIKYTLGTEDGSTCIGFKASGNSYYIDTQCIYPSGGYLRACKFINSVENSGITSRLAGFFPAANDFEDETNSGVFYCDYFSASTGISYPVRGGYNGSNYQSGIFRIGIYNSGQTNAWIGTSLSFKPSYYVFLQ